MKISIVQKVIMKHIYPFFAVIALLSCGMVFAEEVQIELPIENLLLSEEGPCLIQDGMDPLPLTNLHFNGSCYYTICTLPLSEMDHLVFGDVLDMMCGRLPLFSEYYPFLYQALATAALAVTGRYDLEAKGSSDSGLKGKGSITVKSNDEQRSFTVQGEVKKPPGGKTSVEGKVKVEGRF